MTPSPCCRVLPGWLGRTVLAPPGGSLVTVAPGGSGTRQRRRRQRSAWCPIGDALAANLEHAIGALDAWRLGRWRARGRPGTAIGSPGRPSRWRGHGRARAGGRRARGRAWCLGRWRARGRPGATRSTRSKAWRFRPVARSRQAWRSRSASVGLALAAGRPHNGRRARDRGRPAY
jgi:hypothetical protein